MVVKERNPSNRRDTAPRDPSWARKTTAAGKQARRLRVSTLERDRVWPPTATHSVRDLAPFVVAARSPFFGLLVPNSDGLQPNKDTLQRWMMGYMFKSTFGVKYKSLLPFFASTYRMDCAK